MSKNQIRNNLAYLKLLEASQSAFESSEKALNAAEDALTAIKIVHVEAKAALDAATEAFIAASYKTSSENETTSTSCRSSVDRDFELENNDPDEAEEDFIMLSTNRNPIIDLDDDMSPPFLLITSCGPAADHQSDMFGMYRLTREMTEGRSVYVQESGHGSSPCKLFSDEDGFWGISKDGYDGDAYLMATTTPSESPTTVKWQYYGLRIVADYGWDDDPELTVTGLSKMPSCECEVTIRLSVDIQGDMVMTIVAGSYRADGSYYNGRPVLRHYGGLFMLYVMDGRWIVSSDVGDDMEYLESGSAPSMCPAHPRAARVEYGDFRGLKHWIFASKRIWTQQTTGISVTCNKHLS